jgi:hypothetical protein
MKARQEKTEAAMHSIQSKLEETIKHRVEDVLVGAYQRTQNLRKELNEKIDETQSLQETLADTRKDFHEELGLMFQVAMEVEARAERGRGTGTGASAAMTPKFDGTASWVVFRRQFETVAQHECWTRLEKSTYLVTAMQGRSTDVLH